MYQTILYKYSSKEEIDNLYERIFSRLEDTGSLFVFFENSYSENWFMKESIFDVVDIFMNLKFEYINIITYPIKTASKETMKRNVGYIVWFVKDSWKMEFNKDSIREKHIRKDVERGKREKNYNPKWKDPGNVWIPTTDNGSGKITEHLVLSTEEIVNRCISMSYKNNGKIFIDIPNINKSKLAYNKDSVFAKSKRSQWSIKDLIKEPLIFKEEISNPNKTWSYIWDIYFSSSEKMTQLKDNSIDLMVTSPPYRDLKNYFKKGQIGQEDYNEYLSRINKVRMETYRVLKANSSMRININIRVKDKKPILIPRDIINQCKKVWFHLRDIVIWHKSSGIPTHKNNIVDRYEFFLWFVKGDHTKTNIVKINDYKNEYINQGLIRNINRKAGSVGKNYVHPAIYPDQLVDRVIQLCSNPWDTVLDPFLGSGTTTISALNNDRNCIGYEFNEDFLGLIKHRIEKDLKVDPSNIKYHFSNSINSLEVYRNKILDPNNKVQKVG